MEADKSALLEEVAREILSCRACPLHESRTNPVPGEGDPEARIVIIGEAPGRMEDSSGRPFVGPAGRLLNEALARAGISRESVFITNVVKCRPPGNRDPRPEEVEKCSRFLKRQIRIVRPALILALGRHSSRLLFREMGRKFSSILSVRGRPVRGTVFGVEVVVLPTIHPAAALYNRRLEPLLLGDVALAVQLVRGAGGLEGGL